jgi:putative peptidoglycan lipid II flippase
MSDPFTPAAVGLEIVPTADAEAPDVAPVASRWRGAAVKAQVVRAITVVGALTVLSRLAMAGRDVALANQFGTANAVDAFVVALILPLFAIQIISGALPSALVPIYTSVESDDGVEAGSRLLAGAILLNAALATLCTIVLAVAAPVVLRVVGLGFGASKLALTQSLYFELLPMTIFGALAIPWGAVLNAHQRFALPAATPVCAPLIATVLMVAGPASWGIHAVAWGMTIGAALEAVILAIALARIGISPLPRWVGFDDHLKKVARQYAPGAGAALLMTSTVVVDQAVAAAHASGSVATLNYGGKVVSFLLGVGAVAIGTVALPHLSAIVARQEWDSVRRAIRSYVGFVLVIAVPITLLVMLFSRPIVSLLFEHGAFGAADARNVANVQALYVIQIPFFLAGTIGVRTLSALRRNQVAAIISVFIVVVNLIADLAFLRLFGVPGIALATSLTYVGSCAAIFVAVNRILRHEEQRVR